MEIGHIIPHIEALIFASEKPLTPPEITDLVNNAFGFMEDKITIEQVETSLEGIVEKYNAEFYPFEVRESGGGWQFLTKREFHKTVAQLNGDKFMKKLSAAAMETLAIVAYKQPITKSEIEAIRGVSSDYAIQKLLEKDLVIISGRNEEMPGKPLLYSTSKSFMDYFGINTPEELPKIREVLAEQMVEPTVVTGENTSGASVETPGADGEDTPATSEELSESGEPVERIAEEKTEDSAEENIGDTADEGVEKVEYVEGPEHLEALEHVEGLAEEAENEYLEEAVEEEAEALIEGEVVADDAVSGTTDEIIPEEDDTDKTAH